MRSGFAHIEPMKTRHCSQWKRYISKFGEICMFRAKRGYVRFIPAHTPHVSLEVSRADAAKGLMEWRKLATA